MPEHRGRWGWVLVLMLLSFAGGVAAAPTVTDQASVLIGRVSVMVGGRRSPLVEKRKPTAPTVVSIPAPGTATSGSATAATQNAAPKLDTKAEPVPPAQKVAPREPSAAPSAIPPAPDHLAAAKPPAEHPLHKKAAGRNRGAPESAASSRKSASDADEPTTAAPSEPAHKSAASKPSPGSIDDLMADVVTDSHDKNKKRENKDLDAMLKNVQQDRRPEPAPKPEAPPPAATLSAADISTAMAPVKTRSNECAQRLGQTGIAQLKVSVGKDGRVADVRVSGTLANTSLGQCIEKAARAASFPPSAGLRFDYRIDAH